MKIKYYLRGLGVGIVITTLILLIVFNTTGKNISDEEIIARAKDLGMVMAEKEEDSVSGKLTDTFGKDKGTANATTPQAVTTEDAISTSTEGAISASTDEQEDKNTDDKNVDKKNTDDTTVDEEKLDDNKDSSEEEKPSEKQENENPEAEVVLDGTTNSITPNGRKASINIVKGDSSRIVSEKIQAAGIVGDAEDFNKFMKNGGYADKIKVGRVTINIGETYKNIAKILTEK